LKKSGNDVVLFAPDIGRLRSSASVRVVYVPTLNVRFLREYVYYITLFFYLLICQIRERADIFYVREMGISITPAFAGFILRVPHVLEINGLPSVDLQNMGVGFLKSGIIKFFQYVNFLFAHKVITVSENIKSELLRVHRGSQKIVVIENGVNVDLFQPKDTGEMRRLLQVKQDCCYLIFVGSFYPHHGIYQIMRILECIVQKAPDVRLLMVGSGYLLGNTVDMAKKSGLTPYIDFPGEVEYEKVPQYINAADAGIFFLTGIDRINGRSPLKLYEYMACGKPVVTDSTYENFVRENNVGIVVSTEDYDGAADAIIRLLKDRTLMNIQGENGRNLAVSAFTWGITAKKILRVCETMV
jgi:glycosyltransferase involved in cell wall biosynthesis